MEHKQRESGSHLWLGLGVGALLACALNAQQGRAWLGTLAGTVRRLAARDGQERGNGRFSAGFGPGNAGGRRNAAPAAPGTTAYPEGDTMNAPYRPAHRERLYDVDERQRGPAPGQQFQQAQGGVAAGTGPQGSTPGDFRHGGLHTQGHVPEAPHALHRQQDEPDWSQVSQGGPQLGGPGGDAAAWGHVPRAPHAGQANAPLAVFDPEYLQWRQEHLRGLDEDYRAWRQQRFADEFSRWRARAPGGSS